MRAIHSVAAHGIHPSTVRGFVDVSVMPKIGDLIVAEVQEISQHSTIEDYSGESRRLHEGDLVVLVCGERYAPDIYEGHLPTTFEGGTADILSRSGVVGKVSVRNTNTKNPTKVKVLGFAVDDDSERLNTIKSPLWKLRPRDNPKGKLIVIIGTTMNSGKSTTAAACCALLSDAGKKVNGFKATGTVGLGDLHKMQNAGAEEVADFSWFGLPSTYNIGKERVLEIFDSLYALLDAEYVVAEISDGILQKETQYLLEFSTAIAGAHKIILCAKDALGALGAQNLLGNDRYSSVFPNLIGGPLGSSPLALAEMREETTERRPAIDSMNLSDKDLALLL